MANINPEDLAKEFGFQSEAKTADKYENLAKEFGYDPSYVEPKPQEQNFWQGLQNDPTLLGGVKRTGVGMLRGAKNVIDTGAEYLARGTSAVADKFLPENLALPVRISKDELLASNKVARDTYRKEYPDSDGIIPSAAQVGEMGGEIAASLPAMPMRAIGAIYAGAGALPTITAAGQKVAAPFVNRAIAASGAGALGGAVMGAATSSKNEKSLAENVGEGAITGAIAGPLVEGAAQLGKGVASKVMGKISSTRADLAERAEQLGIRLKASQVADSPTLKKFDQVSGWLPFSGSQGVTNSQVNQFTRAVSRTFGKDVEEITPQVISQARKDIGNEMSRIYQGSTINADTTFQNDLRTIIHEVKTNLPDNEHGPIFNNIRNIASKVDPVTNSIDGKAYDALIKYDGTLSKLQQSPNPNIRNAANQIRSSLEGALDRSISATEKEALTNARRQYKSVMTVKDMVEGDPEGKVNPLKLMRKVTQAPGGKLRSGELGELADIGREFFINPADSGTPLGSAILERLAPYSRDPVGAIGAGLGSYFYGAGVADLASGGLGLAANRALREGVNSNTVRKAIVNAGKGSTHGTTNEISKAIQPFSGKLLENRNSKKETTLSLPVALEN